MLLCLHSDNDITYMLVNKYDERIIKFARTSWYGDAGIDLINKFETFPKYLLHLLTTCNIKATILSSIDVEI